ncbi:MAG: hypothetical protein V3V52_01735 [Candidatus Adiutricales bacterium]
MIVGITMTARFVQTVGAHQVKIVDTRRTTPGITLNNKARIAAAGVDIISIGALTHSAPAVDISLNFILGEVC